MEVHLLAELSYLLNQKQKYRLEVKKLRKDKKRDYLTQLAINWNYKLMKQASKEAWDIIAKIQRVYTRNPKTIIRTSLTEYNSI